MGGPSLRAMSPFRICDTRKKNHIRAQRSGSDMERRSDGVNERWILIKKPSRTIHSPRRRWSGQRDSPGFAPARRHALVGRKPPPAVFYRSAMPPFRIPALSKKTETPTGVSVFWSGQRDSNSLPPPWQGGALPNELCPRFICRRYYTKIILFVKQKIQPIRLASPSFLSVTGFPRRAPGFI